MRIKIVTKCNSNRGDTIVEVLLVVTIVGLMLGSAFAILSRNITIQRTSQERATAYLLAQGQIETLRECIYNICIINGTTNQFQDAKPNTNLKMPNPPGAGHAMCFYDNSGTLTEYPYNYNSSLTAFNQASNYNPHCTVNSSGTKVAANYNGVTYYMTNQYRLLDNTVPDGTSLNAINLVYVIRIFWSDLSGLQQNVTISYKPL